MNAMYKELILKSWKDLKQNLALIVPNLLFIACLFASGFLFAAVSGLADMFMQLKALEGNEEQIKAFLQTIPFDKVAAIIGYGVVWVVLIFLAFFLARAVTMGMMADVVQKKKPVLGNAGKYIRSYFWRLVGLNIAVTFIFFLVLLLSFVIGMIAFFITPFILPLIIILAAISMLWLYGIFFLSKQVLVCEQKTVAEAMKESKKI